MFDATDESVLELLKKCSRLSRPGQVVAISASWIYDNFGQDGEVDIIYVIESIGYNVAYSGSRDDLLIWLD